MEGSEESALQSDQAVDLTPSSSSDNDGPPPQPKFLKPITRMTSSTATSTDATPMVTPDISRPSTPSNVISAPSGPKTSRRSKKAMANTQLPAYQSSGDESKRQKPQKGKAKKGRTWDADGTAGEDNEVVLDYSATASREDTVQSSEVTSNLEVIDADRIGTRTNKGQFILKDLDDEVHSVLNNAQTQGTITSKSTGLVSSGLNTISGLFRNVVGGKVLTEDDLDKAMKGIEEHLLKKNVAQEAAVRLCSSVKRELVGVKTGNFESKSANPIYISHLIHPQASMQQSDKQ